MHRFKLHLRGVKVPKLGSLQDRVYREIVMHENQLEAKKMQFLMLLTVTNPAIGDDSKRREWTGSVQAIWKEYVGLLMNVEIPAVSAEDEKMMQYYSEVVKKLKPKAVAKKGKDRSMRLEVSGLDVLRR